MIFLNVVQSLQFILMNVFDDYVLQSEYLISIKHDVDGQNLENVNKL